MSAHTHRHTAVAPAEVLDPVCGMTISPDDAIGHVDRNGTTYYFCSQSCLDQFKDDPDRFLTADANSPQPATSADMEREYTCPMHPEVRQKGPGACPKCGMALEPVDMAPTTKLSGLVRCIRKSGGMRRGHAPSAAWLWSWPRRL